MWNVTAV